MFRLVYKKVYQNTYNELVIFTINFLKKSYFIYKTVIIFSIMKEIYDLITQMGSMRSKLRFSEHPTVKNASVGTHTFRVVLLVQMCEKLMNGIDINKATKIALYHDFGEVGNLQVDLRQGS